MSVPDSASLHLTTAMTARRRGSSQPSRPAVRDVVIKEGTNVDVYNLYARDATGFPDSDVLVGGVKSHHQRYGACPAIYLVSTWLSTYDGTTLKIYINGALVNSLVAAGRDDNVDRHAAADWRQQSIWGEYFSFGRIDEVRVYNRALPQSEIQSDMTTSVTQSTADTTPPGVAVTTPLNGAKNVATSITPDNPPSPKR